MGKRGPELGTGGRPIKYNDPYHLTTRLLTRENRASRNELKTAISELVLFQLHNMKESQLLKPVSIGPLPKFYAEVTENLFQKYRSVFSRETIENHVRACVGKTTGQLKQQLGAIEKQLKTNALTQMYILTEQIYIERKKAEELLESEFGIVRKHDIMKEEELEKELAATEDLWLNCMEYLKNRGFGYYVSKLSSDAMVFPCSLGDPLDPYQYELFLHGYKSTRRLKPRFLEHPKIQSWRAEESEETAKLKEAFETVYKEIERREQTRVRREKEALDRVKPWLIQAIQYGYMDPKILKEIRAAAWIKPYDKSVMELVRSLRREGYKPVSGKFLVELEVTDEPKGDLTQQIMLKALDEKFLGCMEGTRGTKPQNPPDDWEPQPFEQAFLFCTTKIQKDDYAQQIKWTPKPELIQQAKKLWSNIPTDKPRTEKGGGNLAYNADVITKQDMDQFCKTEYGPDFVYDMDQQACVSTKTSEQHTVDLDDFYADRKGSQSLRGTWQNTEPQTVMGQSVVQKTTQRGQSVTKEKKKKRITRFKV
ncbi:hypothetical protein KAU55_00525 [Candidatus Bathyarchaeota archaeon]|nr:hypothetical protein [Candidatus Bathyarchaeota archaeon]